MAHSIASQVRPKRFVSVALAVMLVAAFVPFQAVIAFGVTTTGTTWYVDAATGDDGGLGTEADPLETLFEAVYDRANDGDTILVKPGRYWCDPLEIDGFSNLKIASTGGAAVTTLDGDDDGTSVLDIQDCDGLTVDGFTITGGSSDGEESAGGGLNIDSSVVKLVNSIVTYNYAEYAGGLYSGGSTVVIEGCEFTDNFAFWGGAGLGAEFSTLTVKDSEFTDNGEFFYVDDWFTQNGGGMELYESDVAVSGTTFDGNVAESGGGLLAWSCDLDLIDNVFTDNRTDYGEDLEKSAKDAYAPADREGFEGHTQDAGALQEGIEYNPAEGDGAGIGVYDGEYTVSGTEFTDNMAYWDGGGAYIGVAASVDVSDCTFEGNSGSFGGAICSEEESEFLPPPPFPINAGVTSWQDVADVRTAGDISSALISAEKTLSVERTAFFDNSSFGAPAVYVEGNGPTTMTNCLVEGNSGLLQGAVAAVPSMEADSLAGSAGALGELYTTMAIANCTFTGNEVGGSTSLYGDDGVFDVRNTIFWGNSDSEMLAVGVGAESPTALDEPMSIDAEIHGDAAFTYCDFQYGYMDSPAPPHMTGAGNFSKDPKFAADYNLTSGSPCIDKGTKVGAPVDDIDGWMRPMDGDNDGVRAWDVGAYEYFDNLVRDVGMNRYATAVKACQQHFDSADTVIVATGEVFADGLSAAGLAGSYDAPILLSPHATMPALVKTEIKRLGATHAVVIGGENALSSAVIADLKAMGLKVERIGGVNRYSTAAMIAVKIAAREGNDFSGVGFVARGDTFPDALSVSPIAYAMKSPILLVKPTSMPQATVDVIEAVDFDEFMIAGGPDAVSSMAVGGLTADTTQIGGLDRYDTSAKVSDYAVAKGWAQMSYTGIATGENFPDALTGGAALGSENGVLLLTPYKILHSSPKFLMEKRAEEVRRVEVLGGTSAVSDAVWNSIAAILN